jgi:glycosyltransferase involved in cell wall biosynthesis
MKVSVIIASYNHASTLRRAIDSVLMQKTSFPIETIIVDDGSTDESVNIIKEYYNEGLVSCIHCMEHYGLMIAYREAFKRCTGDYIALCDCDDYWTDQFKLHSQVEYMKSNLDCGLCVTKVFTKVDGKFTGMELPTDITYDKLLRGNAYLHAQSYLIRKSDFDKYINFDKFVRLGFDVWDYPIVLELIQHIKFDCLDFYSAVFVKSEESITQTHSRLKRLKYILGNHKIRLYYILRYGCRFNTLLYLVYRLMRDIYSIIFKRWYK